MDKTLRNVFIGVGFLVVALVVVIVLIMKAVIASGITGAPDQMFGDQHLKTTVALVELHKVRYGKYPQSIKDLKFIGQWDQLALQNVEYYSNSHGTAYFVEVRRGWIGKPEVKMSAEFWSGTGYRPELKPRPENNG